MKPYSRKRSEFKYPTWKIRIFSCHVKPLRLSQKTIQQKLVHFFTSWIWRFFPFPCQKPSNIDRVVEWWMLVLVASICNQNGEDTIGCPNRLEEEHYLLCESWRSCRLKQCCIMLHPRKTNIHIYILGIILHTIIQTNNHNNYIDNDLQTYAQYISIHMIVCYIISIPPTHRHIANLYLYASICSIHLHGSSKLKAFTQGLSRRRPCLTRFPAPAGAEAKGENAGNPVGLRVGVIW